MERINKIISLAVIGVFLCGCVSAQDKKLPVDAVRDTLSEMLQAELSHTIDRSLYIGQHYEGEKVEENTILDKLNRLLNNGAKISPEELQVLFFRDGGGWTTVTNPAVLRLLLNEYLSGADSREDKAYWLNRWLCEAVLISDPGIVGVLINAGANPKPKDIWESLQHITPDFFPSYETMRLLVEELDFDLYRWCGVTPVWWLVYERNTYPSRKDNRILAVEMEKRKADAGLISNTERGGGYFLDPEIFPSDSDAWELAAYYGDEEVLKFKHSRETFTLKGKMKGWSGADTLTLRYELGLGRDTVLHIPVHDGAFTFRGQFDQPTQVLLQKETKNAQSHLEQLFIYPQAGKTTSIKGKTTLAKAKVSGSQTHREYRRLLKMLQRSGQQRLVLHEQIKEIPEQEKTKENKGFQALQAKNDKINQKERDRVERFIKRHPTSIVSLEAFRYIAIYLTGYEEKATLFDQLHPDVKTTPAGQQIFDELEVAKAVRMGAVAPQFVSTTPEGDSLSLRETLRGKELLLIYFWASWSEPCRTEHGVLKDIYETFHVEGFDMLGVALDKNAARWKTAIKEHKLPGQHISSLKLWEDPVAKLFGVKSIPDSFLLDEQGRVVVRGLRGDELQAFVKEYLEGK